MKFKFLVLINLFTANLLLATDDSICKKSLYALGYDPQITYVRESDPAVAMTACKTLYLHGFGGNKAAAPGLKRYYGSGRLPGDVVTFNFPDAVTEAGMDTTKSSLGQWNDMRAALYVLKTLHDDGETQVGITAHSRGGATAVNMVAVLADKTGKYDIRLAEIGIEKEQRMAILTMLQAGHIVLECPLTEVRSVIKHQIDTTIDRSSFLTRLFGSSASPSLRSASVSSTAAAVDSSAPVFLRRYRPWAEQAIQSAEGWNGAKIPTIVHFQAEDEVLGNAHDRDFFRKLQASNGVDCTYLHIGRDGGHNSSFASFEPARNRFLQRYGGSYKLPGETRK